MPPTPPQALEQLGFAVKKRREAMRLSQADLAERGGPGEATVRRLERGEGGEPRAKTQEQFETALAWPRGTVRGLLDKAVDDSNGPNIVHSGLGTQSIAVRDRALAAALNTELGIGPVNVGDTLTLTAPDRARAALVVAGSIPPERRVADHAEARDEAWVTEHYRNPNVATLNVNTHIDVSRLFPQVKPQPILPPTVLAGLRITGPAEVMQRALDDIRANMTRALQVDFHKLFSGSVGHQVRVAPLDVPALATSSDADEVDDNKDADPIEQDEEPRDDAESPERSAEIVLFPVAYEASSGSATTSADQLTDIQLVGELVARLTAGGQRDQAERVALHGLLPLLGRLNDDSGDGPQQLGSG